MDLQLDKARLNRWARLLRTYLIRHQQCEIKHTNAISAIAAMLDYPNANTLTAVLKRDQSTPAGRAAEDRSDRRPDDERQLHEISWAWSDPPSVFQTYAWLTHDEAKRLVNALGEIAEEYGDLADVAAGPRPLVDGKEWHGNLAALVESEIKEAFASQLEDSDSAPARVIPTLITEPPAPPRRASIPPTEAACSDILAQADTDRLIAELHRRGHTTTVSAASTAASTPPPSTPDPAPEELPAEGAEIWTDSVSGLPARVARVCYWQPDRRAGLYRVLNEHDTITHVRKNYGRWLRDDSHAEPWAPPRPGDAVQLPDDPETSIVIERIGSHQPYALDGIYSVIDAEGDAHFVELDENSWQIVLSPDTFA